MCTVPKMSLKLRKLVMCMMSWLSVLTKHVRLSIRYVESTKAIIFVKIHCLLIVKLKLG